MGEGEHDFWSERFFPSVDFSASTVLRPVYASDGLWISRHADNGLARYARYGHEHVRYAWDAWDAWNAWNARYARYAGYAGNVWYGYAWHAAHGHANAARRRRNAVVPPLLWLDIWPKRGEPAYRRRDVQLRPRCSVRLWRGVWTGQKLALRSSTTSFPTPPTPSTSPTSSGAIALRAIVLRPVGVWVRRRRGVDL